jgi:hypothetical protein
MEACLSGVIYLCGGGSLDFFNNHQVWVFEKIRIKEHSVPDICVYIYRNHRITDSGYFKPLNEPPNFMKVWAIF